MMLRKSSPAGRRGVLRRRLRPLSMDPTVETTVTPRNTTTAKVSGAHPGIRVLELAAIASVLHSAKLSSGSSQGRGSAKPAR
jgi:hypothetical protein